MEFEDLVFASQRANGAVVNAQTKMDLANGITIKSVKMCKHFDVNAFLKRRGLIVILGMIMYLCIVLYHLLKA